MKPISIESAAVPPTHPLPLSFHRLYPESHFHQKIWDEGVAAWLPFGFFWVKEPKGAWRLHADPAAHVMYLFKHLIWGESQRNELNITLCCFSFQEGEKFVKKIGGIFAFKVKDGPGGKEASWVVDVKNGRGSVLPNSGRCSDDLADKLTEEDGGLPWWPRKGWL